MKKLLFIATLFTALTSCKSGEEKKEAPKADTTIKKDTTAVMTVADTAKTISTTNNIDFPANFTPGNIFAADKADLHESLKVQQLSKKKIAYEVKMENGGCEPFTYRGVATIKEGDAESDVDEKGNGYFVDEYVDAASGTCGVTIRIGGDKGYTNRARFSIYDCSKACKSKPESETLFSNK